MEYALQNVTILYEKNKYNIIEMKKNLLLRRDIFNNSLIIGESFRITLHH